MAEVIGTSGTVPDWERFRYGTAVSVLVVMLLTQVVAYVRVQARLRKDLPPGPRPWPIIGNLPVLAVAMPHLNLQHLASKFGPLMYLRMGVYSVLTLSPNCQFHLASCTYICTVEIFHYRVQVKL